MRSCLFEGGEGLQACDVISVGGPRFVTKCDRDAWCHLWTSPYSICCGLVVQLVVQQIYNKSNKWSLTLSVTYSSTVMSLYALYSETRMIEVQTKLEPTNFNLLNAGVGRTRQWRRCKPTSAVRTRQCVELRACCGPRLAHSSLQLPGQPENYRLLTSSGSPFSSSSSQCSGGAG